VARRVRRRGRVEDDRAAAGLVVDNAVRVVDSQGRRLDIILSQLAAGNATRHPELGHVVTTETRQFWRDPQFSPNQGQGYHYWHNAETYVHMGLAMAQGMVQAMQA